MSATQNNDTMNSLSNQGEFHARKQRSEPMDGPKHQAGRLVGNEAAPEFHAEQYTAGTAPKSRTFQPDPTDEVPTSGGNALDTFGGDTAQTTSATVDCGPAHPLDGETSHELRHDGHRTRKHQRQGLEGVGADNSGLRLPRDNEVAPGDDFDQELPGQTK